MKIYAFNITESISSPLYNTLLSFVSNERRKKINKFIRKEDADRSLAGSILLRQALIEDFNFQNKDIIFHYNKYNKPYLMHDLPIFFNISHSENWVVCAINNCEVGIDVEKIRAIDFDIAKSFFAKREYNDLMNKTDENKLEYFYDLWTLKESYIKACGKGLSIDLKSFSLQINQNTIAIETTNELKNCFFHQYNIDENYKLSVCSLNDNFPKEIIFKTLENLNIYNPINNVHLTIDTD